VIARRTLRPAARLAAFVATVSATVVAVVGGAILAAGPALAIGEHGDPGGKLSWLGTLAIYLGIPVAVAALIALLVFLPSFVRGPRYRPGRPWLAGPSWFGAAAGGETAAEAIAELPTATTDGGGASARW
jgi:ABC-type amino acid transport system permease subunit